VSSRLGYGCSPCKDSPFSFFVLKFKIWTYLNKLQNRGEAANPQLRRLNSPAGGSATHTSAISRDVGSVSAFRDNSSASSAVAESRCYARVFATWRRTLFERLWMDPLKPSIFLFRFVRDRIWTGTENGEARCLNDQFSPISSSRSVACFGRGIIDTISSLTH
jgi:hypothetical protein